MMMCDALSRWFRKALRTVVALVLVGVLAFPAAGEEIPLPPSFLAEVSANFQQWDLDGDGTLSLEETTRLVPQPSFRDASAAALAAVHFAQRSVSPRSSAFPRGLLMEVPASAGERNPPFEYYYATGLAHIRRTERRLFATDAPSLSSIHQGRLGDCYFLATLGAVVNRNPKDVARFIRAQPDGSFAVQFADGKQITIRPLTDAEIALGSSAGQQGLWLNVLEKAYGAIVEIAQLRRGIVENALDALGDGGDPSTAMGRLTGHDAGLLRFRPEGPDAVPGDRRVEGFLPVLRSRLLTQQRNGLIACCATAKVNVPPGMARQHLYAILDFDPARDIVLIWNPWGNFFEPRGTPGPTSGYRTQRGQFSVPLADFIRIFERVVYETDRDVNF